MQSSDVLSSLRPQKENDTAADPASARCLYANHRSATISSPAPILRPSVTNATVASTSTCMPSLYTPLQSSDVAFLGTPHAAADSFSALPSASPQVNKDELCYFMTDAERRMAADNTSEYVYRRDGRVLEALHELHSDVAAAASHTSARRAALQAQSQECYDALVALEERVRLAEQRCRVVEAEAETRAQAAMRDATHAEDALARLRREETVATLRVRAAMERADAAEARATAQQTAVAALEQQLRSRTELAYSRYAKLIADAELDAEAARGRLQAIETACTAAEARTRQAVVVAEEAERTARTRLAATWRDHEARMVQLAEEEQRRAAALTALRVSYAEEQAQQQQQQQQQQRHDETVRCRETAQHAPMDDIVAHADEGTPHAFAAMHGVRRAHNERSTDGNAAHAAERDAGERRTHTTIGQADITARPTAELQRNDVHAVVTVDGQPHSPRRPATAAAGSQTTVSPPCKPTAALHANALLSNTTAWPTISAALFTTTCPPRSSWLPYVNELTRAYGTAVQRAASHWAWMLDAALETMQRKVELLLLTAACIATRRDADLSQTQQRMQ